MDDLLRSEWSRQPAIDQVRKEDIYSKTSAEGKNLPDWVSRLRQNEEYLIIGEDDKRKGRERFFMVLTKKVVYFDQVRHESARKYTYLIDDQRLMGHPQSTVNVNELMDKLLNEFSKNNSSFLRFPLHKK